MANALDNAITLFGNIQKTIEGITPSMVDVAEDTKRAELRLGISRDGSLPIYSQEYYVYKKTLSTYMAPSQKADLFVTGKWSESIKTVDSDFVLSNTLESPPDYADDLKGYADNPEKGWSSAATESVLKQTSEKLTKQIQELL